MVMRLAVHGNTALVWPDLAAPMEFPITAVTAGQPGIGAAAMPPGNTISLVQLGAIARTAPAAVRSGQIGTAASWKRVDLQWQPVAAAAVGPDLAGYWVYRDGAYLGRVSGTVFTDETVTAGKSYTYSIFAVDQHENMSPAASATVVVPPSPATGQNPPPIDPSHPPGRSATTPPKQSEMAGATGGSEPRRVGVRPTGTYWGGPANRWTYSMAT